MTYPGVFLLVNGGSPAGHVAAASRPPCAGYFQRVERPKPTMMKPNPIAMFHSPRLPIG